MEFVTGAGSSTVSRKSGKAESSHASILANGKLQRTWLEGVCEARSCLGTHKGKACPVPAPAECGGDAMECSTVTNTKKAV